MTSAALIPAERPEPAIKASSAPGTIFQSQAKASEDNGATVLADDSPANSVAGEASRPSVRRRYRRTSFTMGRSARSGRSLLPANRRATPMVLGARARRSPLRRCQNLAGSCALKHDRKSRTRLSHPSGGLSLDGIEAGLSGFLLPLLARPRHLPMQEILSSNARLKHRQEPGRVCRVVVSVIPFRVAACHGFNHASGDVFCPTNALYE